jgi:hypothetical protein
VSGRRAFAAVLLACAFVAGCGGDDGEDSPSNPPPEARPDQFPRAEGRTLAELRRDLPKGGPVLAPTVSHFVAGGESRLGFGLFTTERAQIADARAAVYIAPVGGGEARGPYVAHYESLEVKPQFTSETTSKDPDAAKTLYVADVPFAKPGRYEVLGMARLDDRLVAATSAAPELVVVSPKQDRVPGPGDPAPEIHTPTEAEAAGDLASIDTRVPPVPDMHQTDFAEALGRKPIVLLFATPLLCQSRVCGPVVDIALQLQAEYGDEVEFIHMEIYNDNEVNKGARPQVNAFHLPSEPWVFLIDREGKVVSRMEGAFSSGELDRALEQLLEESS